MYPEAKNHLNRYSNLQKTKRKVRRAVAAAVNPKVKKDGKAMKLITLRFLLYVLVLLYILFWFLVDQTVHFHYCVTLWSYYIMYCSKKTYRTVNSYYCTALPIIRTVLKNQACNIYKYCSYNRNLRVWSCSKKKFLPLEFKKRVTTH